LCPECATSVMEELANEVDDLRTHIRMLGISVSVPMTKLKDNARS
jgi:hypothetical protein